MHPLRRVFWGFLIVFVDIRLGGFDVIPDVIGWVIVLAGLLAVSAQHAALRIALIAASIALVVGFVTEYVLASPSTADGTVWGVLDTVASTVFIFAMCTGMRDLARAAGNERIAAQADVVRWLDVALTVVVLAIAAAAGFPEERIGIGSSSALPLLALPLLAFVAIALAVVIWFLVLLFLCGRTQDVVQPAPAA